MTTIKMVDIKLHEPKMSQRKPTTTLTVRATKVAFVYD